MAKPRVFVSSTFYDLKHIRSSLEHFIESLGYEAILSEEGNIPYRPDRPLDESCYLEAEHADIFVLIVGGRYGSAVSDEKKGKLTHEKDAASADDCYTSITRREYERASNNIPTYIFIEKNVYAEYFTYLINKDNGTIYAHVDSDSIFKFIDFIKSKSRNNPIQTFDKHIDIQNWLKEQWAGLFRDLLHEQSTRSRFIKLEDQINKLSTISGTLKTYLESIIKNYSPADAISLIENENRKIIGKMANDIISQNFFLNYLNVDEKNDNSKIIDAAIQCNTFDEFRKLFNYTVSENKIIDIENALNRIRHLYNVPPLTAVPQAEHKSKSKS